jgi:hypothetical protein
MAQSRDDVRRIALEQPHAVETPHRGAPSFRVEMRIFCMMPKDAPWVVVKLDRDDQLNMFEAYPGVIVPARLYAHHGWTYLMIEQMNEAALRLVLHLAWTHVAPKRLVKAQREAM